MSFRKNRVLKVLVIIGILLLNIDAFSQNKGEISGVVKDLGSAETLPGANVIIKGTSIGAATNIEGYFQILNIKPGTYTVIVSSIGFEPQEIDVTVSDGQSVKLDINMSATFIMGEEVIVTAQRKGQNNAINQQLTSDEVKNVVSAERLQELPDANAAESLSRLPGISLGRESGEGSTVIIRGLAPKYNKVTVNGIDVGSSESGDRSSSMSMISSENLAGMEVIKTNLPSMSADAIGGSVNMLIARAKEEPVYMTRWYGGYSSMENDFAQYKGFVKFSQRFFNNKLGIQASVNMEKKNLSRDRLTASFSPSTLNGSNGEDSIVYDINNVSASDRLQIRKRQGATLIIDFGDDQNNIRFWNFYNKKTDDIIENKHSLSNNASSAYIQSRTAEYVNTMYINAINGEHKFYGLEMDWALSHSYSKNNNPYSHEISFAEINSDKPDPRLNPEDFVAMLKPDSAAQFNSFTSENRNTEDRRYSGNINIKKSFNFGSKISIETHIGGKYQTTNKTNEFNGYEMTPSFGGYPLSDINLWFDDSYVPRNFLGGQTTVGITLNPDMTLGYFDVASNTSDPRSFQSTSAMGANEIYNVVERTTAGYFMGKLKYGQIANLIFGARYESDNNDYNANYRLIIPGNPFDLAQTTAQSANIKNSYWFPMASIKIKPSDWFDIRASVSKTLSRPDFIWLVPLDDRIQASIDSEIEVGDPYLKPAISKNYDLYLSVYKPKYGLLTVGVFNKQIDNISYRINPYIKVAEDAEMWGIEERDNILEQRYLSIPINAPKTSTVKGFEIDIQANFVFLPGILKGFIFHGNYTKMFSESYLPFKNVEYDFTNPRDPVEIRTSGFRSGPMPGQAEDLINLTLGYDYKIVSIRVSYNHQGESLDIDGVGRSELSDRYVNAYNGVDISAKVEINKHISVFFNGTNITNSSVSHTQASTNKYRLLEHYGAYYSLGIQIEL